MTRNASYGNPTIGAAGKGTRGAGSRQGNQGRKNDVLADTHRPRHRRWNNQLVIDAVLRRQREGGLLSSAWREDKPLFRAAVRWFGTWQQALVAAGLQPNPRQKWSCERVLADLRTWARRAETTVRNTEPKLAAAAVRFFGSLEQAMDAADVEPEPGRWHRRRVIREIQDRYVQGLAIHRAGFGDRKLAAAAKRRFGSWAAALASAGLSDRLPATRPQRRWSRQAVLDAIQLWHDQGRVLADVAKHDQGLYCAAKKHLGGWRAAVAAAGLQPTHKCWTAALVIEELRRRHARGESLASSLAYQQDAALVGASLRLLGSWRKALAAAGLEPVSQARQSERSIA